MSRKFTLASRAQTDGRPGFQLYEDVLDKLGADGGLNAPVYLRLEGVSAQLSTMEQPGITVVTVLLPRDLAVELGLVRT